VGGAAGELYAAQVREDPQGGSTEQFGQAVLGAGVKVRAGLVCSRGRAAVVTGSRSPVSQDFPAVASGWASQPLRMCTSKTSRIRSTAPAR